MTTIFIKLLNLSISAGMLVLLVFAFRLFLKKYSRRAVCLLWIVVALRLIIPFSFESSLSFMPSGDFVKANEITVDEAAVEEKAAIDMSDNISDARTTDNSADPAESIYNREKVENTSYSGYSVEKMENLSDSGYIGETIADTSDSKHISDKTENNTSNVIERTEQTVLNGDTVNTTENAPAVNTTADGGANDVTVASTTDTLNGNIWEILAFIWLLGAVLVFAYLVIGYARMRNLTEESVPYDDTELKNVYICDRIDTAFILGVVRPRIYLPGNLTGQQVGNILAHEKVHLRRKDYIWKFIGFVLLMVYWFNPLIWLAYAFLCKDIEFACDEQVISDMNPEQVKEYSDTLLVCSTDRHFAYGCPLAFGEVAVKDRVKAVLNYKKPLFWVIIAAFVLLIGIGVFFFTKPSEDPENTDPGTSETAVPTDVPENHKPDLDGKNDISSAKTLLETIAWKYKHSLVHDFDFTYVMPNGTEFGRGFGYAAGLYFKDYVEKWPEFSSMKEDESLTKPWHEDKKSDKGYFIISTNEEYDENGSGYNIYIKDGYVHLFYKDDSGESYVCSYEFKDEFTPNLYSIRRVFFNKDMYDIYVQNCPYEEEIKTPGGYYLNRGYLVDLDGDGTKEKLFVASCGWINYPEPENLDGWVTLNSHSDSDPYSYYGSYPDSLIYINGVLCNADASNGIEDNNIPYMFAVTDINESDKRYELLIDGDPDDVFYVYKDGKLSGPKYTGGNFLSTYWMEDRPMDSLLDTELSGNFKGDGTFSGVAKISLKDYNYSLLWGMRITWGMNDNGDIERLGEIFDIFCYDEAFLDGLEDKAIREQLKKQVNERPEDYYLRLEQELDVSETPDPSSPRTYMKPGYVMIDKTDGISKIHLTYVNFLQDENGEIQSSEKVSGWIDLKNLESYVRNYEATGLEKTKDFDKLDVLFSNIVHAG